MDQYDPSAEGDKYDLQFAALSGWFLGPRAENAELFNDLVLRTFKLHEQNRRKYYPTDPAYIKGADKQSHPYKAEKKQLKEKLTEMNDELSQSTPIFSPRFQGHMNWDITMPSFLGYISGMLWNPNNVDVTASPVTTPYEILAANQICDMIGFDRSNPDCQPWGHITCGGSIANIEALWSSRNLKFYPLSLQDAVNNDKRLEKAKNYEVMVPPKRDPTGSNPFEKRKLSECTTWQLLNVDVDEACKMASRVAEEAVVSMDTLSEAVHPYSYTSVGIASFLSKHNINSPKCFAPATCHYSWPKAATVLGIGEDNLILIHVDANARQELTHLQEKLQECVEKSWPVISVTAVMGSTEESAMDPLVDILKMRDDFRGKGLNFCVLADAAWGAYMRTMLIDPSEDTSTANVSAAERKRRIPIESFVPISPLSPHVKENLNALRRADTVTSDPHKTGYCPYPAGGLSYRNGTMKDFVRLAAPEVFHSEEDLSVGINGLEGSKPGAATAGVLLSHRVIGLDKYGYGRILGQCVYGSKMFYCMWLHLAKPTDPFIIKPYIPCSPEDTELMKQLIIGKTNIEIALETEARELLAKVGPDALITKFGINLKMNNGHLNNDVNVSTEFSQKVGLLLSVNADKDLYRVPMIIFQSMMEMKTFGEALKTFEISLGLTQNNDKPFACMVNTVMNPWQTSSAYVTAVGDIYREACYIAHGWMTDPPAKHRFVTCGRMQFSPEEGTPYFFTNLIAKFGQPSEEYQAIVKFAVTDMKLGVNMAEKMVNGRLFLVNQAEAVLYQMLEDGRSKDGVAFDVYVNLGDAETAFSGISLRVLDVVRIKHFAPGDEAGLDYPDTQEYYMFGQEDKVYLSHIVTKQPDFQQVVEVTDIPMTNKKDKFLIWYGVKVSFPDLPVDKQNPTVNPFTNTERVYNISFRGRKQKLQEMAITLKDNNGWFDNSYLNAAPKA